MTNEQSQELVFYSSRNLKAQAALEYLMTYGWMLLAVSVIGGTAFQTLGFQCVPTVTGFEGETVQVDDFRVSAENELIMLLDNQGREDANITKMRASNDESGGSVSNEFTEGDGFVVLEPGESDGKVFGDDFIQSEDACTTWDVEIQYDVGPLDNVNSTGQFTGPITGGNVPDAPSGIDTNQDF